MSDDNAQHDERDRADMIRLAAGHDATLNDLMERHAGKLFNYLVRSLQNEEDAADAAQETFVRVFQNRTRFDARQRFTTWLYAIATNLVKDRYRYRVPRPSHFRSTLATLLMLGVRSSEAADAARVSFFAFIPERK